MIRKLSAAFVLTVATTPVAAIPITETDPRADGVSVGQPVSAFEFWKLMRVELAEPLTDLQKAMEPELKSMILPTGPFEKGWSEKGIDLDAYLDSLPGKIPGNALLTPGQTPMLEFRGAVPANILDGWEMVFDGAQSIGPADADGGAFVAIGPRHVVFVGSGKTEKIGTAFCLSEAIESPVNHLKIYRDSEFPLDLRREEDVEIETEALMMSHLVGLSPIPAVCTTSHKKSDHLIVQQVYNRGGRPLGQLNDADDVAQIVQQFDLRLQLTSQTGPLFLSSEDENGDEMQPDAN